VRSTSGMPLWTAGVRGGSAANSNTKQGGAR